VSFCISCLGVGRNYGGEGGEGGEDVLPSANELPIRSVPCPSRPLLKQKLTTHYFWGWMFGVRVGERGGGVRSYITERMI
jgi:hypothetical protein